MTAHVKSLGFYKHGTNKPLAKAKANLKYIEANHDRHDNKPELFSKDQDGTARKDFYEKLKEQPERGVVAHKLVLTVSDDERKRLGLDMKELVRDTMNRFEIRNGQSLDWVAAIHDDKGHPHAHIMIRGYDNNGKQVGIFPKHIKDFQEIAEKEKNRQATRNHETSKTQDFDLLKEMASERAVASPERITQRPTQKTKEVPQPKGKTPDLGGLVPQSKSLSPQNSGVDQEREPRRGKRPRRTASRRQQQEQQHMPEQPKNQGRER